MSEFEFFTVAISIVLALGIGRLLDGIGPALASDRRYWVHFGWIIQKLLNHIYWWWGLWSGRDFDQWNLAWFVWMLLGPIVLYLQASALVTSTPALVTSWKERFFAIRPWFFAGNIALSTQLIAGRVVLSEPLVAPVPIGLVVLAALAAVGMATDNERIHRVIIVCALSVQVVALGVGMFLPGTL